MRYVSILFKREIQKAFYGPVTRATLSCSLKSELPVREFVLAILNELLKWFDPELLIGTRKVGFV